MRERYMNNRKLLIGIGIYTLVVIALMGIGALYFYYYWQDRVTTSQVERSSKQGGDYIISSAAGVARLTHIQEGIEFESLTYRFKLIVPKSWGDILTNQGLENSAQQQSKLYDLIRLTSKDDPQRYILVEVVKIADQSDSLALGGAEMRPLLSNSEYAFYYSGSQDMANAGGNVPTKEQLVIMREIAAITKSFTLVK